MKSKSSNVVAIGSGCLAEGQCSERLMAQIGG